MRIKTIYLFFSRIGNSRCSTIFSKAIYFLIFHSFLSYDVIFTKSKSKLLNSYLKKKCNVLFSAEDFCWPDKSLSSTYPIVSKDEYRYLNSGGFIGPAKDIYSIIQNNDIADDDDDQLYYTKIFLDDKLRVRFLNKYSGVKKEGIESEILYIIKYVWDTHVYAWDRRNHVGSRRPLAC